MRTSALLLTLALLGGCASTPKDVSSFDAGANQTVLDSGTISLGRPVQGGSFNAGGYTIRAEARCPGRACQPELFTVSVYKSAGGNDARSSFDQVAFETETGTIQFTQQRNAYGQAEFYDVAQGELVRLEVPRNVFDSFANDPSLSVRLGATLFRLPHSARLPFRTMLGEG